VVAAGTLAVGVGENGREGVGVPSSSPPQAEARETASAQSGRRRAMFRVTLIKVSRFDIWRY
jgi:hypothetical protein